MRHYFSRFSERPQDKAFKDISDEQLNLIQAVAEEEDNPKIVTAAAGSTSPLFGIGSNQWGMMNSKGKMYTEKQITAMAELRREMVAARG
eukprot:1853218-Alexandrium_andersonii.AAC.1